MPNALVSDDLELAKEFGKYASDPLEFVYFAYPWRRGELEGVDGPRAWQREILGAIADHLNSEDRFNPLRIAVSSGHGIGKSALISMICGWAMSCYEDARINVTANTGKQLDTKTWPEIAVWFRRLINAHWFKVKGESISSVERGHEETWRTDAVPWSENNPAAFAGLHNKGKIVVLIMDESSEIADIVWETSEGATTDENTVIVWLAFGNPTQNSGRFSECFGRFRHRWKTYQIDSRTVEGTNKKQADEWVRDYGEDSDFCRIRVRGVFPRAGSTQFIDGERVRAAQLRVLDSSLWSNYHKVMSVDVARFGSDRTQIGTRQGPKFQMLDTLRGKSVPEVARQVIYRVKTEMPRLLVIDGDGIGGGVVDLVREDPEMKRYFEQPEHKLMEFHGGESPKDPHMYFNRRSEVWGLMRDWLPTADIPEDAEMETDLTGPQYGFSNKNAIQLEKKDDMKRRGLASPDKGDTLAMSFAFQAPALTHRERVEKELAATPDPVANYLIQLREHTRQEKQAQGGNWWE